MVAVEEKVMKNKEWMRMMMSDKEKEKENKKKNICKGFELLQQK